MTIHLWGLSLTLTLERLLLAFALGVGVAVGGAFSLLFTTLSSLAMRIMYLRRRSIHALLVKFLPAAREKVALWGGRWPLKALLPLAGGVLLALKAASSEAYIVSFYFLIVGGIVAFYLGSRERKPRIEEQVEELVVRLFSIWSTKPQLFAALDEVAGDIEEPLRGWARRAVGSYRLGVPVGRIWRRMKEEAEDPYLRQLVDILSWAEEAGMEEVREGLQGLEEKLRARKDLRRRAKVSLAMVSGTTRFFQAADGAAVILAILFPYLWSFYSETPARQLLFCLLATWFLAGAFYMQSEMERVKERVL